MSKKIKQYEQDCACEAFHIKLYLTYCFYLDTKRTELVVVCRTKENAERYARGYKNLNTRTWVDEIISDHAFGRSMYIGKE